MRLRRLTTGHRWPEKIKLGLARLVLSEGPPDVVRTLLYRRELFGKKYSRMLEDAMRGPSAWSIGERELMAMFVSAQNHCVF
jgi:hypothetical protein